MIVDEFQMKEAVLIKNDHIDLGILSELKGVVANEAGAVTDLPIDTVVFIC